MRQTQAAGQGTSGIVWAGHWEQRCGRRRRPCYMCEIRWCITAANVAVSVCCWFGLVAFERAVEMAERAGKSSEHIR